jgi:5-hydroxyisourate hydrolase
MSGITTHVLDTAQGRPARGVGIALERRHENGSFGEIGRGATDDDGRLRTLVPAGTHIDAGVYRLTFDTGAYYAARGETTFYPTVIVTFEIRDATQHFHVPLLLSPYGYSTYRGS